MASLGLMVRASDTMAFFGIIEKVVFEPNPGAPERVQLWGAFADANVSPQTEARSTTEASSLRCLDSMATGKTQPSRCC
jgi:hypothetical protein